MAKGECTCSSSVWGGFKKGTGFFLAGVVVVGAPLFLLAAFALPAYLGSLARAAGAGAATLPQPGS